MVLVKIVLGDMEGDTASLRSAAPHWSLEGDSQLLSVLQSLHQTIITKCQETNSQLDAMVSALDNASIDLQNVNNKFMALSNSQFVESRVYEDEVELSDNITKQESPKPDAQSSLSSLKFGLRVLESLHEVVAIIDSDSDEEHSTRRVLRPRARGRLPHVVGSQAWRNATHAGLHCLSSDADSDDSTDKRASALEEYSDSDTDHHTASASSLSSMTSHAPHPPGTSQSPSRHDTQTEEQIPESELDESPQQRKLYTVEKPIPAQVFPDEPPPLDRFEADSDDDIFAELHKQSYPRTHKSHNVPDDLFESGPYLKRNSEDNDIGNIVTNTIARENSPLFSRSVEPESKETPPRETYTESVVKKPVGGISLFGSKGSESIGAAILKRNQKQSSSESDGTGPQTKETNIIEDLFTKPVKNVKKEPSKDKNKLDVKEKTLFNDNIFDDIDDIFTSNVIAKTRDNKDKQSVFDGDLFKADNNVNNDLFNDNFKASDNDKNKPRYKSRKETREKVKSIFDSDSEDDLFSDVKLNDKNLIHDNVTTHTHKKKSSELNKSEMEINVDELKHKLSSNIFDDYNEDDLFGNKTQSKEVSHSKTEIEVNTSDGIQYTDDIQHDLKTEITRNNKIKITENETKMLRSENEGIEEEYISDTKSINNSVLNNDANNVILVNKSELDKEDIKSLSTVSPNNEIEVTAVVSDPKVPLPPEIDFLEEPKPPEEIIVRVLTDQNHSKNMFVDIFEDLPPAFEKPMEPKKSKNVNALFDDDSDDEALFFKKDDIITDEKPDLEFKSDRFQIFHDEPPDIVVDFSQKSRNTNLIVASSSNSDLPDHENRVNVTIMLENSSKQEHSITKSEKQTKSETLTDDLRSENKPNLDSVNITNITNIEQKSKTNILKLLESERDEDILKRNEDEDIFSDPDRNDSSEETSKSDIKVYTNKDTDSSESEKKAVGRLKPVTININVSSLLPGAVPKKSKSYEETDGQTASTESQMVKTDSFKENLDSEVLDNKLSKERAKIQVKRRPSTRRARLEAVRKSGLDVGSDSTDNSSSFDEPVKEKYKNNKISVPYKKLIDKTKLTSEVNETNNDIKKVTSKVVYILNDEDIFEVPAGAAAVDKNISDDQFNTMAKENATEIFPHFTTSKVKKQSLVDTVSEKQMIKVDKTKKSLFDDMSDDETELFKKPVQKSVFDSDSESDLFSGKKGKEKKESGTKVDQKVKESKVAKKVTKALFSDDSDEDLFGGKTKQPDFKEILKPKPSATKTAQIFEDPLSVSRDDEA